MMTIEEYIVGRSVLPTDGGHTMLEHLQSMMLATYGEQVMVDIVPEKDVVINLTEEVVSITVSSEDVTIVDTVSDVSIGVDIEDKEIIVGVSDE